MWAAPCFFGEAGAQEVPGALAHSQSGQGHRQGSTQGPEHVWLRKKPKQSQEVGENKGKSRKQDQTRRQGALSWEPGMHQTDRDHLLRSRYVPNIESGESRMSRIQVLFVWVSLVAHQ